MNLLTSHIKVKNEFPKINDPAYRIAIVGEAPGENEEALGRPFVGYSGDVLNYLCQDARINRQACFVGNVCQARPPGNKIEAFDWDSDEIQSGIEQLKQDIAAFNPNLILCLGGTALHAAKTSARRTVKPVQFSITDWRGSLCTGTDPMTFAFGRKFMSAFHPASLARVYENRLITRYDFRRARAEGESPVLRLPNRLIELDLSATQIVERLDQIYEKKPLISLDIEGGVERVFCLSIAPSPWHAFIIPFCHRNHASIWQPDDEARIWQALARVLCDPAIPKVLQNAMYDRAVLAYTHHLLIRNVVDDTMLKHWEHQHEMPKDLGFQCSFYTREPFYKGDIKSDNHRTFWTYCCRDSAVTSECNLSLDRTLSGPSLDHYRFNVRMLNPMLYSALRGINFDTPRWADRISKLEAAVELRQAAFNNMIGHEVNVRSPKQMAHFLYEELGLPKQYKRGVRDADGERKVTTDYEAVLKLALRYRDPRLMELIRLREVHKRISDLKTLRTDRDGRVRFSYNVVGSVTGRLSCSGTNIGACSANGQTIADFFPNFDVEEMRLGMRDLFIADDDHWLYQCDLSGADAWTVACHCAALGDPTMLEDLQAGLKIPKLNVLMVEHGASKIGTMSRAQLKELSKSIDKHDWRYLANKKVQHGTNYGMTPPTIATTLLLDSYGELVLSDAQAALYQNAYLTRYPGVRRYHARVQEFVMKGKLPTAAGAVRNILGRKNEVSTVREVLSHEPQLNTTWTTNRAILRQWDDPDNRTNARPPLHIEPLHQVHDAAIGQFRKDRTEWAVTKIRSYFDNPITIAGIQIKIPFDGGYGRSWGELEEGTI